MSAKQFVISVILGSFILMIILMLPTYILDPCFHYRKPEEPYLLYNERYQNDGIVRYFDYDAIITGSSLTENIKTSDFERIFNQKAVKIPFSGAEFKEVNDYVEQAIQRNEDLRYVVRCLDLYKLDHDKDAERYPDCPTYLYDDNIFNDINYLCNKDILIEQTLALYKYRKQNKQSTSFDEYANWNNGVTFGKEAVFQSYQRADKTSDVYRYTDGDDKRIYANMEQNVVETALNNPDITFYIFLSPYSILYWDDLCQQGRLQYNFEVQKRAIEILLTCPNIRVYSYCNQYGFITDFDNYKDIWHYSEECNTQMMYWMRENVGLLTEDNYLDYIRDISRFYTEYDYDSLFR